MEDAISASLLLASLVVLRLDFDIVELVELPQAVADVSTANAKPISQCANAWPTPSVSIAVGTKRIVKVIKLRWVVMMCRPPRWFCWACLVVWAWM